MKIVISTINSKYIHINNSVYIIQMYLGKNSEIITHTLKDNISTIIDDLVNCKADYYFFSIYIWNVEQYKKILPILRKNLPNSKIIVGGPEVSYDSSYLFEYVDFIYRGEVNGSVNEIVENNIVSEHIIDNPNMRSICNYNNFMHDIVYYENIKIYNNQIFYIETSKGCPFKCSYCMSSLENKVINMDVDKVYRAINFAIDNNVKVVKFLDRTFNVDEARAKAIMNYIISNCNDNQSYQFEIAPEIISKEFLEYLKSIDKGCFRFEIGIQSVHNETVNAVDRFHNYKKYEKTIEELCKNSKIVTHFDLIAGLPYETYNRFIISFNTTFRLFPEEYQLGMLKILNGTKLKYEANIHRFKYQSTAPYQFIENKYLSKCECQNINLVEDIVDRFYNSGKFKNTFKVLVDKYENIFDLLLKFNNYIIGHNFKLIDYQLYDIYKIFYDFLCEFDKELSDYVILDYISVIKNKPKRFYKSMEKKHLNKVLTSMVSENMSLNYLYKYIIVEEITLNEKVYIIKDLKKDKIKIENATSLFLVKNS